MKKIILLIATVSFLNLFSYSQKAGKLFQATLKRGTVANTVMVAIKSSASFSGKFSNVQFTLQLPTSISPQPVVSIRNNPLEAYIPTANYRTNVTSEDGFYTYLFAAVATNSPTYNFTAGAEINALEVQVSGVAGAETIRLASLPNGGSIGQLFFYTEVSGNDNTNDAAMFYGTGAVNGNSYTAYSYVPLSNVILPIKMLGFTATKKSDNAYLKWTVENETTGSSHYEIERSVNGTAFAQIGRLNVSINGNTTNSYSYTDANISRIKSKGILYYRLKQVDKNGPYVYSDIRKVLVNAAAFSFGILTNPIKNSIINLTIQAETADKGVLQIVNTEGKMVYKAVLNWEEGYLEHPVSLPALPAGSYVATLWVGKEQYRVKFVK